jgi:hypothetical protein
MKRTTFAFALALAAGFSGAVLAQAKEGAWRNLLDCVEG